MLYEGEGMKVINMLADYEQLCIESDIYGNWIAWKNYISKYESLYSAILEVLYMSGLEDLKPMIEHTNFRGIYNKVQENIQNGCVQEILKWVNRSMEHFDNRKDFVLYIGCELGNIRACVLPVGKSVVLYFGIETIKNIEDIKNLVPHEISHFIRLSSLIKQDNFNKELLNTFKERVIAEGLGLFTSFKVLEMEDNICNLSKILGIMETNVQSLILQEQSLEKEILSQIDYNLTADMMRKYFGYTEEDRIANNLIYSGYFIGFRIIQKLCETKKYDFRQITEFSADKILKECFEVAKSPLRK